MEKAHTMHGVEGRLWTHEKGAGLFSCQVFKASRPFERDGFRKGSRITVEVRMDDQCGNGHNSFSITGHVQEPGRRDWSMGGCIHDEIAEAFPELAHLIPWHLSSTDGPMHYAANTVYHAGDRDCNGLRKGEKRQIRNGRTGQLAWKLAVIPCEGEPYEVSDLDRYIDADEQPTAPGVTLGYIPWCRVGDGKERDLDAARASAVWPEATDAELMQEPDALRAALAARLPGLLARFRADIEAAGLAWTAPDTVAA